MKEKIFYQNEKIPNQLSWKKDYFLIGLTGTLAAGKSTVAEIFKKNGYKVIQADQIAKKMYFHEEIKKKIIDKFGTESYKDEKTINIKYLSNIIFSNTENVGWINELIHPWVKKELKNILENAKMGEVIVYEIPLLFESKYHLEEDFDLIIVIDAPIEIRKKRALTRNNWDDNEFLKRENYQLPPEQKRNLSNCVIWNDDNLDILEKKINYLIKNIEKSKPKNLI